MAGEVVDAAESKRRMAEAKATGDHNFYMMEMGPGLIIDARTKCATLSSPIDFRAAIHQNGVAWSTDVQLWTSQWGPSSLYMPWPEVLRSLIRSSAPLQHLGSLQRVHIAPKPPEAASWLPSTFQGCPWLACACGSKEAFPEIGGLMLQGDPGALHQLLVRAQL